MKKAKTLPLDKIIQGQGFGTRAYCRALIEAGVVTVQGQWCDDPDKSFALEELNFTINDEPHLYREHVYILLNKPAGFECSQKPKHHKSVLSLLPAYLRERSNQSVQPVGRLDVDTTGLLLLSDDGQFIHKNTSPKKQVDKTYHATCKHPITDEFLNQLKNGVLLHDENETIKANAARALDEYTLELVISEGKYHQVKRMIAAASNRCEALCRIAVGEIELPKHLALGQWVFLEK
ncbi:pseudouridine synthase [Formosimonas limnophila]|uniref:Pseudouridine synthase n=1 Tax=Formosimonas limnophila TaxID=1384487 RepID=A0A8J3FZM0_9BURK|nr:16S rRNA pseudouridine(516) synthase [Formosimonas limnophila]GHA75352.1 pseudouridine synthase [Formosimonas limnophila]